MKMNVPVFDVSQTFTFDIGHFLPGHPEMPHYGNPHGHSFVCEVTLRGEKHLIHEWVIDFDVLEQALQYVAKKLDHKTLNEIEGLSVPTMENITLFIADELQEALDGCGVYGPPIEIHKVKLTRPTIGEACTFRPNFGPITTQPRGSADSVPPEQPKSR